jgi:hypothetical protein
MSIFSMSPIEVSPQNQTPENYVNEVKWTRTEGREFADRER